VNLDTDFLARTAFRVTLHSADGKEKARRIAGAVVLPSGETIASSEQELRLGPQPVEASLPVRFFPCQSGTKLFHLKVDDVVFSYPFRTTDPALLVSYGERRKYEMQPENVLPRTRILFMHPYYFCLVPKLARMPDGALVATYTSHSVRLIHGEETVPEQSRAKKWTMISRSTDAGRTWSQPYCNDFGGWSVLGGEDMLVFSGNKMLRIHWNGNEPSWGEPVQIWPESGHPAVCRLEDGSILVFTSRPVSPGSQKRVSVVKRSLDEGRTWSEESLVAPIGGSYPILVACEDGGVTSISLGPGGEIVSRSFDGGRTWTPCRHALTFRSQRTGTPIGYVKLQHAVCLRGVELLAYARVGEWPQTPQGKTIQESGFSMTAAIRSYDGGYSWEQAELLQYSSDKWAANLFHRGAWRTMNDRIGQCTSYGSMVRMDDYVLICYTTTMTDPFRQVCVATEYPVESHAPPVFKWTQGIW